MEEKQMPTPAAPLVSAIITLYNKESWIGRAVRSVLEQTEKDLELIVVDDGSTDNSVARVREFDDYRIRVVSKKNAGLPAARNTGIGAARGRFVAFLDADDEWLPWHLSSALHGFRSHPEAAIVANRYLELAASRPAQGERYGLEEPGRVASGKICSLLDNLSRGKFEFCSISAVLSRAALRKHNILFDEKLTVGEDLNFFIRMSLVGSIYLTDAVGAVYHRCDSNSMMNLTGRQPMVTPDFFKRVSVRTLSATDLKRSQKFMFREYLKRAYQNRGLLFNWDEVNLPGCQMPPSTGWRMCYLLLRHCPSPMMRGIRAVKKLLQPSGTRR